MKIRMKKLFVALLAFAMLATGTVGTDIHIQAASDDDNIAMTATSDLVVTPGETTHIKIPVTAMKDYIMNPSIKISAAADAPFTFNKPTLRIGDTMVTVISTGSPTMFEFDVTTDITAAIKDYPITVTFSYTSRSTDTDTTSSFTTKLKVTEEKDPAQLTVSYAKLDNTNIGGGANLSLTVKNEGELSAKSAYLVMDYASSAEENYSAVKIKLGDIAPGATKNIILPISILNSATAGKKTWVANFTYKTVSGTDAKSSYNIYVSLSSSKSSPKLAVDNISYKSGLKAGQKFSLTVDLENIGKGNAKNITANIDDASITQDGIIKKYYTNGINIDNLEQSDSTTFEIPLAVSKYATTGMKNLKIVINYTDSSNTSYSLTESIYVDVTGAAAATTPNIIISNVVQSPEQPLAGEKVVISLEIENRSAVDAKELKIYADGLTNATFIPVESKPYHYIPLLKAGAKKKISIPLVVSTSISDGLNNLTLKYKYLGGEESSVIIPVRNIKNEVGSSKKPKLIISNYDVGNKVLKAGSTFKLTLDIYNTNANVAAKNIQVTVVQADNIFTVTQGSNSFFINKMDPGETVSKTLELKVKSDATTKAYPLKITTEYEYDGMVPNPETGESGVSKTEEISLQAVENARPVVNNIQLNSYDGSVMVGGNATVYFEFYNMGKAPLNNVTATLECDGLTMSNGNMQYIGNVEAGGSQPVEMEVVPNVEGTVKGILHITYEDSNGDTVELKKDFEGNVMPAAAMDPGMMGDGTTDAMNPAALIGKKEILPIWAFVILQIAIFAIFAPVSRKIIINIYKAKLRKKEEEQY